MMQTTIHDQSRVRSNGRYILMTKVPHGSTDKLTKEHSQRESKCINIDNFIIAIVFQGPASAPAIAAAAALGTNPSPRRSGDGTLCRRVCLASRVAATSHPTPHARNTHTKKKFFLLRLGVRLLFSFSNGLSVGFFCRVRVRALRGQQPQHTDHTHGGGLQKSRNRSANFCLTQQVDSTP